jgi:RNA polymerase sigma-70 factor (ECF subfamily)
VLVIIIVLEHYSNISDHQLILLYKQNKDRDIVGELFKRYTRFVFLVSMKYLKDEDESKDNVMTVFEKLFDDLLEHDISNFKSWLYRVTQNQCLMFLRKVQTGFKNLQLYKKDSESFMEFEPEIHLTENKKNNQKIETIQDAVNQLNKEQAECVNLFYLQGKSYTEIADITSYSLNNVKSHIQNGKRNLKIILTKAGIPEFIIFLIFSFS